MRNLSFMTGTTCIAIDIAIEPETILIDVRDGAADVALSQNLDH